MKKFFILLFILLFVGCATTNDIVRLEQQMTEFEEMALMSGTVGAGASFYPFSGGLTGGQAGKLDKITGVVQGDTAIGILEADATYGDAVLIYVADNSGDDESLPDVVDPDEAGTIRWKLVKVYGVELVGPLTQVDSVDSDQYTNNSVDMEHISDLYAYQEIPVAWMKDGTSPPDDIDDGTTRSPYAYRTFAHDADEDLNFVWIVPADLSGSVIQYRVYYLVTAAGPGADEGVAFGLSGVSLGDNDATNGAKGAVVVITDDTLNAAQHDVLITGWSGDVTITNLAAGEVAEIALIRDVSDAVDDYAQVVGVFMVQLRYVQNPAR